ncbi:hypothetical protein BCR44DRAFT_1423360 [Catenaria anguillulae PL171]|uniref:ERCC1-like central domain-containing protein n=1 Tax=Catenaria anguillulae PL171 TaxID=765915 RepID=A0A1Y2I6L5_9FUNG|nr:hypothetical protein BCR44DRAFT_1423360 [Catenaria anguillulae PL171]
MNPSSSSSASSNPQAQGQPPNPPPPPQPQRPRFVVPSVAAALDAPQPHLRPSLGHGQPAQAPAPGSGQGQGTGYGFASQAAPTPPFGATPRPPPSGSPMPMTATSPESLSRPAWQHRANTVSGPPMPPPLPLGPMGPPQPGPTDQQSQSRSIYHEGAQPLITSGGPSSRASYARKRKALNDDDLFKLPDLPGAHPAPASSSSSSSSSAPVTSSAAPSTNPTAVLASRSTSSASIGSAILVNPRQRGNPVLDHILTVPWEYSDGTPADYVYHRLHPEYIVQRIRGIQGHFELRVLLVLVDVGDHVSTVREVNGVCIANDLTLILAANNEECAKYLEMYKSMEHRPADALMGRHEDDYSSRLTDALTQIKGVNPTVTDLASCPGIGEKKAQRIYQAFRKPFIAAADTLPLEDD